MAARSSILQLAPELREWLESELIKGNFSGYRALTDELNTRLGASGAEPVSKSAVHRHGQEVEERIAALKRSTEVAKTIAAEVGDDEGAMNEALQRVVQEKLFNVAMSLEVDIDTIDIVKLGHVAADIGRASVQQKKFAVEVRARAQKVAESVASTVRKSGLSAEAADKIRRDILGIAK